MPLYDYKCGKCGNEVEVVRRIEDASPECCGCVMEKQPTFPVMVKMKGMGGYPSRRKFVSGSAPYTTGSTKPWLSVDPVKATGYGF